MVKTDPKKVPSQIFFLLVHLGTIAQPFMKKNFSLKAYNKYCIVNIPGIS